MVQEDVMGVLFLRQQKNKNLNFHAINKNQ
jgi:hypothetical protein